MINDKLIRRKNITLYNNFCSEYLDCSRSLVLTRDFYCDFFGGVSYEE